MTTAAFAGQVGNLPAEVTRFIGRRQELAEARRLLETSRLVTLAGVSGVGKTRLALKLAVDLRASFPDGVWFVELSGLHDPDLLAHTVAETLDVPDQSARDRVDLLAGHLAAKRLLLVLDTCEHLVDACAKLAEALLRAAPQLHVLATSREALDVPGEHILQLQPLTVPECDGPASAAQFDALALFLDRAAAVRPGFALREDNQQAVVHLCRRLDGIPLAIELAAGRLRALSVHQIVERLDDRFRVLGGARTSLPRHQTLRAAVGWSHELCTASEQLLWARLSVFAGGFDLEAAEQVCDGDDLIVCDTITRLVEKSIVLWDPDGDRYRMLDTIREYGAQRLRQLGEYDEMRRRHRDWYAELARRARAEELTGRQIEWFARLRRDLDNLRAALEFSLATPDEAPAGLRIGVRLTGFWLAHGLLSEGRLWLERALAASSGPVPERFDAAYLAGQLAVLQSDPDGARPLREEASRLACNEHSAIFVAAMDGLAAMLAGDTARARELLGRVVAYHRRAGFADILAMLTLPVLAGVHLLDGDLDVARTLAEECMEIAEASGERYCHSYGRWVRPMADLLGGDPAAALPELREVAKVKWEIGDRMGLVLAIDGLAICATGLGDAERAARLLGIGLRMWEDLGMNGFGARYVEIRDAFVADTRKHIGTANVDAEVRIGAKMSYAEAIDYALSEPAERTGGSGPLTPRELEIAELVAEGLSNREIADRLVIAKRTADSHIEHILAKLGFVSRTQIAAWYAERRP